MCVHVCMCVHVGVYLYKCVCACVFHVCFVFVPLCSAQRPIVEFSLEDGRKLKIKAMREEKSKKPPASNFAAEKVRIIMQITSDLTHHAPLIV